MKNAYKQKGNLVDSIISHLMTYKNTSIKKDDRLASLRAAKELTEYIVTVYQPNGDDIILVMGLNKILVRITEGLMDRDNLQNYDTEIGFLRVLKDLIDK